MEKHVLDMTSQELMETYLALMKTDTRFCVSRCEPAMNDGIFKRVSILEDTAIHYALNTSTR